MKRMLVWTLAMLWLLPGWAAAEPSVPELIREGKDTAGRIADEAAPPEMAYYEADARESRMMSKGGWGQWDVLPEMAGGMVALAEGYLHLPYQQAKQYRIEPMRPGEKITYLNPDLSVRWELTDERLDGAWYRELTELSDALLLGGHIGRVPVEGLPGIPSLMLLDKATGAIRWQWDPGETPGEQLRFWADDAGIYVATDHGRGPRNRDSRVGAQLSLLDLDGQKQWTVDYYHSHGALWIRQICPLGDGLLLLCCREDDEHIVLYVDRKGAVRGWFLVPGRDIGTPSFTYPGLARAEDGAVYLGGWTMPRDTASGQFVGTAVFFLGRIDEKVFSDKNN